MNLLKKYPILIGVALGFSSLLQSPSFANDCRMKLDLACSDLGLESLSSHIRDGTSDELSPMNQSILNLLKKKLKKRHFSLEMNQADMSPKFILCLSHSISNSAYGGQPNTQSSGDFTVKQILNDGSSKKIVSGDGEAPQCQNMPFVSNFSKGCIRSNLKWAIRRLGAKVKDSEAFPYFLMNCESYKF